MKRRTKIVCTLGPAVNSAQDIRRLIEAGMNVARINCSHGDWDTRRQWVEWIREASPAVAPVGILVDLQGPKFRLGEILTGFLQLQAGEIVQLGPNCRLALEEPLVLNAAQPGDRLLMGDGDVELKVTNRLAEGFEAKVLRGGQVRSRQGVTIVGKSFDTPSLTSKDLEDAEQAARVSADYVALSYVRTAEDIQELRGVMDRYDRTIGLCAKIETKSAVREINDIIKAADLIMVARGDLGLQMDLEDVPLVQKKVISRCLQAGKPVITATQMLESMIRASRPTRAEATDVANAILDGTDAVMLSAETAMGDFPIEAVEYMSRIAEKAETGYDDAALREDMARMNLSEEPSHAVALGVAQLAAHLKAKAIVTNTASGYTARLVAKFRPRVPILAATYDARTQGKLSVISGVDAIRISISENTDSLIQSALDGLVAAKRLKVGDSVVISAGVPAGTPGNTNLIMTQVVR